MRERWSKVAPGITVGFTPDGVATVKVDGPPGTAPPDSMEVLQAVGAVREQVLRHAALLTEAVQTPPPSGLVVPARGVVVPH